MKIAQGSLAECRNYLISASDLGYGDSQKLMVQLDEDGKLLAKYHDLIMALVK